MVNAKRFRGRLWAVTLCALLFAGAIASRAQQPPSAANQANQGYPVVVEGEEILRIYTGIGAFSAQHRAESISERLKQLIYVPKEQLAKLGVSDSPYGSAIQNGDNVLLIVTDEDAKYAHLPRAVLAKYYLGQIQRTISGIRERHSSRFLILAGVYGLVTLAVYLVIVWLLLAGSRRLLRKLETVAPQMKGVKIQQSEILGGRRVAAILAAAVRFIRVVVLLILTWIFLATEFNYFPWTRQHGRQLLDYITTPVTFVVEGFVNYLPKLAYIVVILAVMYYVLKFVRILANEFERGNIRIPGFYPEWIHPTYKIIRFLLWAFTAVLIYPFLPGENSPAFKGVGLFLGVLFSLGSTSAVANVVAGVILTYTRGFRAGDWVKIGDNMGEVTSQSLLATHIKTIKNEEIIIPNSVVLNNHVTNYSLLAQSDGLILYTSVTIGYSEPWRQIHALLIDAALKTEYILAHPAPFVLQNALDDSYVEYQINAYTRTPLEMVNIYSALRANIQDCFYQAGVEIMSPVYSALRDGNHTAIPGEFLPANYRAPGFKVSRDDTGAASAAVAGKE